MTLVVDASVALRWVFNDEQSEAGDAVFRQIDRDGAHAPALFPIEVGNALTVGLRRQRITDADLFKGIAIIQSLPIAFDDVDAHRVLHDVAQLARQFELSVYDAMYLELAMRLNLPLATFDERLTLAAGRSGTQLWRATAA